MKTYIGIVRDHSVSMRGIARSAARDYNEIVTSLKEAAVETQIDSIATVVECGRGNTAAVRAVVINSNVAVLQPIPETSYITDGSGTPLYDSVAEVINLLQAVPDANDPEVNFVVMVITDGEENRSRITARTLADKMRDLSNTDRWTFTFRVPKGYARALVNALRIPEGNVLEWETSAAGMQAATVATTTAVRSMYTARKSGVKSTPTFYAADLSKVSLNEVRAALVPVTNEVVLYPVELGYHDLDISDFMWHMTKKDFVKGTAFYQLTKTEKEVQDYKKILVRERTTGVIYAGDNARQILGLPKYGSVRLVPGNTGNYDVFIQSTSLNRKVKSGSKVLYWPTATIEK